MKPTWAIHISNGPSVDDPADVCALFVKPSNEGGFFIWAAVPNLSTHLTYGVLKSLYGYILVSLIRKFVRTYVVQHEEFFNG